MQSFIPTSLPPKRRLSKAQRESSRLLDGFSTNRTRPIDTLSESDLLDLRSKTKSMLDNSTIVATLPDKGSKLKEKINTIDNLLASRKDTPDTVTEKVSKLSLENNNRPNIRKKSVADANLEACRINLSSNMLRAHVGGTSHQNDSNTGEKDTGTSSVKEYDDGQQAKVRMISLEESVRLQNYQRDRLKEEGYRKQLEKLNKSIHQDRSITDDISTTMNRLQLDSTPRVYRPADDNTDDDEGSDEDENSDNDFGLDSAYEEDDSSIQDEEYVQDDYDNNQR
ncbi:uncharacterized protein BX664DRAFT_340542 [Halteromyces radiatus]|uniref:uncharacterized protein n=1 Tax=Halteromyces radiatus TaxID=101107 RepID=UPI00221E59BD|nr:uncharacterized protein BX664DRAFT_340542 [Halteromyces radiatus]KAI8081501.1 hypothetical protein BX664DRAFT_340542 [Halteromyces radiatus]